MKKNCELELLGYYVDQIKTFGVVSILKTMRLYKNSRIVQRLTCDCNILSSDLGHSSPAVTLPLSNKLRQLPLV